MGRLYWKIFLGFWLTTVMIVAVTSWSVSLLTDEPDESALRYGRGQRRLAADTATAELLLNTGGEKALLSWLRIVSNGRRHPWIVNAAGQDLLGRRLPPPLQAALKGDIEPVSMTDLWGPDGTAYKLLRPPFERSLLPPRPRLFTLRLAVAVLVSGLVCWWLAHYLTQPIRYLQTATRRLAAGDLSVRVQPGIGKRRDEIAELGADFDRMAARLESLLAAQRQLLRDVSHELRSPLARLQVALGLARRRSQGAQSELDRIEREAQRLDALIGQLLSLMRLESGADVPAAEPVELAELLHSVAQDADFEAENHQRRVAVTDALPTAMLGDSKLLRSALENLVRNAVRHTAENTTVELTLRPDPETPNGVVLRVRDYGPGVPEPDLPRLFDPFFRVEAARERGSGGYGLGLAIAARAVQSHGGAIEASNVEGGGLEVRVRLPVRSG